MECWNTGEPEYRFVIPSETKDLAFAIYIVISKERERLRNLMPVANIKRRFLASARNDMP